MTTRPLGRNGSRVLSALRTLIAPGSARVLFSHEVAELAGIPASSVVNAIGQLRARALISTEWAGRNRHRGLIIRLSESAYTAALPSAAPPSAAPPSAPAPAESYQPPATEAAALERLGELEDRERALLHKGWISAADRQALAALRAERVMVQADRQRLRAARHGVARLGPLSGPIEDRRVTTVLNRGRRVQPIR